MSEEQLGVSNFGWLLGVPRRLIERDAERRHEETVDGDALLERRWLTSAGLHQTLVAHRSEIELWKTCSFEVEGRRIEHGRREE